MHYIILGIAALFVGFTLYKAFWKPPEPDPEKRPWDNPDITP